MKIASLYVTNFLGIQTVELQTPEPVQLFAGPNGAGKSSLRDAISLALTGDLGRVGLKKESPALIREGANAAVCELVDEDGDTYRVSLTAGGKLTDSQKGREPDAVLPYVLDAQRFARLEEKERRAFLFNLMGLKADAKAIVKRMTDRGLEAAKVERIAPLLRAGFSGAHDDARAKATEAKGAWKAVTGEAYGSEKVKTWEAKVPKFDAKALAELSTQLTHCDVAIGQWQQTLGRVQAEEQRRAGLKAKLPALQEQALRADRIHKKLDVDQAELKRLDGEISKAEAAAGGAPRVGLVHELGWALHNMIFYGDPLDEKQPDDARVLAAMAAYEQEHGKVSLSDGADPEAAARLPALRTARATCASAVANDQRDFDAARQADAQAAAIREELASEFDQAAGDEAAAEVTKLKAERAEIVAKSDALHNAKQQADAAEKKTAEAAKHAADVAAWDAIAEALSPDGIPGEMLSAALGPLNSFLVHAADDTEWPLVKVHSDMSITAGGREYRLLSESEQWRTDAMLAATISNLSGAGLLVLDRFDVLDLAGRSQLLAWLDNLAENGEISSALIFGTLKAPPSLGDQVGVHWIENGHAGQQQLQEAA